MVVVFGGVGKSRGHLRRGAEARRRQQVPRAVAGAVLGKIPILIIIILFIQKRPRGLFALKGRAVEA